MDQSYYESFFELTKGNYYSILGVPPKASQEEIKAAYRNAVKKYHPDLNNNSEASRQQFIQVQQAYEVLSDPQQRARYDAELQRKLELFLRGAANRSYQTSYRPKPKPTPRDPAKQAKLEKRIFITALATIGVIIAVIIALGVWESQDLRRSNQSVGEDLVADIGMTEVAPDAAPVDSVTAESAVSVPGGDMQNVEQTAPNDNLVNMEALLGYRDGETSDNAASAAKNAQTGNISSTVQSSVSLVTGAKPYAAMYGSGRYDSESMSYLEVRNGAGTDAVVMLYDTRSGQVVRHAYLCAGATYKLRQLPSGIFDMRVYQGINWNPNKYMGPNAPTGGFESHESFTVCRPADYLDMRHTESYNGVSYPTYTVTLYKVQNGNLDMQETSSRTFFQ